MVGAKQACELVVEVQTVQSEKGKLVVVAGPPEALSTFAPLGAAVLPF